MVAGGELLNCVAEFLEYAGGFKGLVEVSGISGRIPQGFRGIPEQFDRVEGGFQRDCAGYRGV